MEGLEYVVVGIIVVVLLFAGPKRIPELAKSLGQAVGNFRKALKETKDEIEQK